MKDARANQQQWTWQRQCDARGKLFPPLCMKRQENETPGKGFSSHRLYTGLWTRYLFIVQTE